MEKDAVRPAEFTTDYRSVVGFGKIRQLTESNEIQHGMELLIKKYSPEYMEEGKAYIAKAWDHFNTYVIVVEYLSAKGSV